MKTGYISLNTLGAGFIHAWFWALFYSSFIINPEVFDSTFVFIIIAVWLLSQVVSNTLI